MRGSLVVRDGGCFCGAVRYRLEGEPSAAGLCHCATCRRIGSGTSLPFATFERARFTWLAGEPASVRSSPTVRRCFCHACGSPLTYESTADPAMLDVMIVSLDAPDTIRPTFHVWTSEAIGWDVIGDGLPAHARSRPSGTDALQNPLPPG